MNTFDFYKELYYHEIDRKGKLDSYVNIPISIISAIVAILYFLFSNFEYDINYIITITFIVAIGITLIFVTVSIVHLLKLYNNFSSGHKYSFFPFASELNKYHDELQDYYSDNEHNKSKGAEEFNEYLIDNAIKHIDHNMIKNDSRSLTLYKTKKYLLFTLLFLFLTLIPFGFNFFQKTDEIQKIEIVK